MRFSVVTAVCAAPLALAGTLQADLVARGAIGLEAGVMARTEQATSVKGNGNAKANTNSNNNNNQGTNVVLESVQSTEIIIIWANAGNGAATSTVNAPQTVTQTVAGAAVAAATHSVVVGGTAGLVYTPDTITAAVGDMVVFSFQSTNHTVTQSAFATPCEALVGGIDSGFMANVNNSISPPPQLAMQVTVSTPIWMYCKQAGHCGKGMTFSINPTAAKTQAQFAQLAIAQNGTGTTSVIAGGAAKASSATTVVVATSAAAAAPAVSSSAAGTMVAGTGTTVAGGACSCSCLCGVAAFPNAAVQGLAAFGGLSGAMPMSALEA